MMMSRKIAIAIVVGASVAIAAILAYRSSHTVSTSTAAAQEQRVLYWYDPMHPEQHFDKPGKSPFMDMQLVPRYAQSAASETPGAQRTEQPTVDAKHLQSLGIRFATVQRSALTTSITAVGNIVFNERDTTVLQTRSAGFVQRVYNLAAGDIVKRGAPLVDLLVPEWLGVQQEIMALQASGDSTLLAAARARALALGMPAEVLAEIARGQQARQAFTISSPQAGVIKSLDVRAGMSLATGAPIATINGIERVWLEMAVPQALAGRSCVALQMAAVM